MSALALPRPSNMHSRFGELVESDIYMIADRIRELDPNLYIYRNDGAGQAYSICEKCADGVERLVFRTHALDARVIHHLEYLLHVPFEARFEQAQRIEARAEEERREKESDELYEKLGRPMWTQLEHDGFIETRGVSFPKRGITGGKGSKGKA